MAFLGGSFLRSFLLPRALVSIFTAANAHSIDLLATMKYNTPPAKNSSSQDKAVALAFPDLVNDNDDDSFLEHWNRPNDDEFSDLSLFDGRSDGTNCEEAYSHVGSVYTSGEEGAIASYNDKYHIHEYDEAELPSSPTQTATTAYSEWTSTMRGGRRKTTKAASHHQERLAIWEKVLVSIVLLIVATCVAVTVVIIVLHGKQISLWKTSAAVLESDSPTRAPVESGNDDRLESVRAWLEVDPLPGTPQYPHRPR